MIRRIVSICVGFGLALSPACISGCGGTEELLTYSFDVENEITIPGRPIGTQNPLLSNDVFPADFGDLIGNELEQSFSTENIDKDAVSSVIITAMRMEVTEPEENGRVVRHLQFLDSMAFTMAAGTLDPVQVAYSEEGAFDSEVVTYDFPVTKEELIRFLDDGDELEMATAFETDPAPGDRPNFETTIRFVVTIEVVADPVGAVF
jgi:hypothetical protein